MSDVSMPAAPPPSAPAAPAPASEVPINPNPINPPAPIGSQAPDKPEAEIERRPSRRETIANAFKKAEADGRPGPAKPRIGHNQPPEPTEPENTLDLKKRPTDQPRERGRFASREQALPADAQFARDETASQTKRDPRTGVTQPQARGPQLPEHAPYRSPPPRMHPQAQSDWHSAPESVRGEVYRMAGEFTEAYRRNQGDVQEMEQIRHFQRMAQRHGTTLQKALTNYTGMEELLRRDPIAGLDLIVHNLNLTTADGHRLGFRDVAYYALSQSPEQHQMVQAKNAQMAQSHQLMTLQQRQQALEYAQQQQYAQQQFIYSRSAVDQFAEAHPRFDELSDLIYSELTTGYDLEMAYRRADLLRPAHAAQTRSPSAQTRPAADRSISGGPDGPDGSVRRSTKSKSVRDSVARAINHVNGSF